MMRRNTRSTPATPRAVRADSRDLSRAGVQKHPRCAGAPQAPRARRVDRVSVATAHPHSAFSVGRTRADPAGGPPIRVCSVADCDRASLPRGRFNTWGSVGPRWGIVRDWCGSNRCADVATLVSGEKYIGKTHEETFDAVHAAKFATPDDCVPNRGLAAAARTHLANVHVAQIALADAQSDLYDFAGSATTADLESVAPFHIRNGNTTPAWNPDDIVDPTEEELAPRRAWPFPLSPDYSPTSPSYSPTSPGYIRGDASSPDAHCAIDDDGDAALS